MTADRSDLATNSLSADEVERGARAMQQLARTQERICDTVLPIYGEHENGTPALRGSAFLVDAGRMTFFVTAAHVVEPNRGASLYVRGGGEPVQVAGAFTFSRTDVIDIAFAPLTGAMAVLPSRYRALTMSDIDVSDWPAPHHIFSFVGYPASANKPNLRDKTLTPTIQPYSSHQPLLLKDYERLSLNPCSTIGMFFDLTRAQEAGTKKVIQPRKPHGISGGPVWRMGHFADLYLQTNREKVVGVAVEYRTRPGMLLGTRIAIVIEAIRKRYPSLSRYLPWDPRCQINVTAVDGPTLRI